MVSIYVCVHAPEMVGGFAKCAGQKRCKNSLKHCLFMLFAVQRTNDFKFLDQFCCKDYIICNVLEGCQNLLPSYDGKRNLTVQ
jgi:hypothetical protein